MTLAASTLRLVAGLRVVSVAASSLILAAILVPALAEARPVQQPLGVIMPDLKPRPPPPPWLFAAGDLGDHRLVELDEEVTIDPRTGAASATVAATLIAGPGGLGALLFLVDEGLLTARVYNESGADLPYLEQVFSGIRYTQLDLTPPLPPNTRFTVYFEYAGTLLCPATDDSASCDYGGDRLDFAFLATLFTVLYDPNSYDSTPYYRRRLSLTVPAGINAYVSANELSRSSTPESTTIEYEVPVRQDIAAYVAIFGELVERDVPGASVPTRVIHLASEPAWVDDIVTWTAKIINYLDEQAGRTFPYPELNIVKLPVRARFPGTAGPAMSLLSEAYDYAGPRYFEETYAHETSHIWWAVLTTDYNVNTRLLSEGLATFTQIDYTGEQIQTEFDRETYLARRYNEMENISLYSTPFAELPPVVPPPNMPIETDAYTEWAYLKGAAVLELLRVQIGDQNFARALASYAGACVNLPCTTQKFEDAMSAAAGEDLSWFFDQWVYGNHDLEISIDFEPTATGATIELTQAGDATNDLELELILLDGTVQRERVRVNRSTTTFEATTMSPVIGVRPNPRYEAMIRFRSAHDLDVDFDAELDGADLVRCAYQVGQDAFGDHIGEGVTAANVVFESRCDKNRDGSITREDLNVLLARFPEVR